MKVEFDTEIKTVGIISDTHDQIGNIQAAIKFFIRLEIDMLIHCGDWVSPCILPFFQPFKKPIVGIFGNNDGDKLRHLKYSNKYNLDISFKNYFRVIKVNGQKIAIYHGEYPEITNSLIHCGEYEIVMHGHTHNAVNIKYGNVLSINPGTLLGNLEKQTIPTVAVYDVDKKEAKIHKIK
jgi:hypothetical protein